MRPVLVNDTYARTNDLRSLGLPEGYDTTIGYLAQVDPEALELQEDHAQCIEEDQLRLDIVATSRHIAILQTVPPRPLLGRLEQINVYPVSLLREVLGA